MKVLIVWLILCGIWSSTWIFIKIGLDAGLPPVSFAALRFIVAATVLLVILAIQKNSLPRARGVWLLAGLTGLLQFGINYGLLFWGEQHISSGLAAVLQTTIPAFGLVFAKFYLPAEPITLLKFLAILLGIAGVAVIFYEQLELSGAWAFAGSAAVVAGAACASLASVLTKAYAGEVETSSFLTAQMICGLVPLAAVGFALEGNPLSFNWNSTTIFAVLYLALVGSITAFWMFYWLLKNLELTRVMIISLVTPIVAVLIGAAVLGETLPAQTLSGGALIMLSVGFVLFRRS